MMRSVFIFLILFFFMISLSLARETKQLDLSKKLSRSDAVLVGRVRSVNAPAAKTPGVYSYAIIEVEKVIKGENIPKIILFVTRGYSGEMNPLCCFPNKKYLIFAHKGFDIFDITDTNIAIIRKGADDYYAPVNGPYSTYEIIDDYVIGWPKKVKKNSLPTTWQVIKEIRASSPSNMN